MIQLACVLFFMQPIDPTGVYCVVDSNMRVIVRPAGELWETEWWRSPDGPKSYQIFSYGTLGLVNPWTFHEVYRGSPGSDWVFDRRTGEIRACGFLVVKLE